MYECDTLIMALKAKRPAAEQRRVLRRLASDLGGAEYVTAKAGHGFLSYLLSMAKAEAERLRDSDVTE